MKKFLAALLTLVLILAVAATTLAASVEVAAYKTSDGENEEYYGYEGSFTAAKAEASTHCGAGEILIRNYNGEVSQGTGVTLSATAKVEGAEVAGNFRAGTENYNGHGTATAAAGTASATAAATVGYGKNGLEVSATGGAEANLVEAKGSVGVTVGCLEVNAGASVKVGVGAKASVGYSDGKLKVELGAALGIGASVNVEINVGKIANKTCEYAKKAWNWLTNW